MKKIKVDKKDLLIPLEEFKCKEQKAIDTKISMVDLVHFFIGTSSNIATITEENRLKGIISKNDMVIKYLYDLVHGQEKEINDYMIKKPFKLDVKSSLLDSMMLMLRREVTSVVITNQENGDYVKTLDYDDTFNWFLNKFESYFEKLPVIKDWSYLDEKILEKNFAEIEKDTLDTTFFTNNLQKVLIRNNLNIDENTTLKDFLQIAKDKRTSLASITAFESRLVGIITPNDIFHYFKENNFKPDGNVPIKLIMKPEWLSFMKKHSIGLAVKNMVHRKIQHMVIMDEDRYPLGIARAFDILKLITDSVFYDEGLEETGQLKKESA